MPVFPKTAYQFTARRFHSLWGQHARVLEERDLMNVASPDVEIFVIEPCTMLRRGTPRQANGYYLQRKRSGHHHADEQQARSRLFRDVYSSSRLNSLVIVTGLWLACSRKTRGLQFLLPPTLW